MKISKLINLSLIPAISGLATLVVSCSKSQEFENGSSSDLKSIASNATKEEIEAVLAVKKQFDNIGTIKASSTTELKNLFGYHNEKNLQAFNVYANNDLGYLPSNQKVKIPANIELSIDGGRQGFGGRYSYVTYDFVNSIATMNVKVKMRIRSSAEDALQFGQTIAESSFNLTNIYFENYPAALFPYKWNKVLMYTGVLGLDESTKREPSKGLEGGYLDAPRYEGRNQTLMGNHLLMTYDNGNPVLQSTAIADVNKLDYWIGPNTVAYEKFDDVQYDRDGNEISRVTRYDYTPIGPDGSRNVLKNINSLYELADHFDYLKDMTDAAAIEKAKELVKVLNFDDFLNETRELISSDQELAKSKINGEFVSTLLLNILDKIAQFKTGNLLDQTKIDNLNNASEKLVRFNTNKTVNPPASSLPQGEANDLFDIRSKVKMFLEMPILTYDNFERFYQDSEQRQKVSTNNPLCRDYPKRLIKSEGEWDSTYTYNFVWEIINSGVLQMLLKSAQTTNILNNLPEK